MSRIFWDSMLFIYLLEGHKKYAPHVNSLLEKSYERDDILLTSYLALAEVLVGVEPGSPIAQTIFSVVETMGFSFVEFDRQCVQPFRRVRTQYGLRGPDAMHLACASAAKTDFAGETVLVTAGGTREAIDPVRFIGNRSSGRMGYAVAEAARRRGARVILITAPASVPVPEGVEILHVVTAEEMRTAMLKRLREATIVVMAAAVSDYRVRSVAAQKIKRESARPVLLELEATKDILREVVAQRVVGTIVVGFAAETEDMLKSGSAKLERKGVDAVVVNDVSKEGIGFDAEQNAGTFLTKKGAVEFSVMSKAMMAERILDETIKLRA